VQSKRLVHLQLGPARLDLVVAVALTLAAEAQILAGGTATGLVLAPALVSPAITLSVAVRRRWPTVAAAGVISLGTAQIAIWGDPQVVGTTIAYMCAVYGLAVWTNTRRFVTVTALAAVVTAPVASLGPDTTFTGAAGFTVIVSVAMVITRRIVRGREERARVAQRERDVLAREALVAERARIAGELHDAIAHKMSMVVMQAGAERRMVEEGRGSPHDVLQTIEDVGRDALNEMRRLVGMLRSEESEPLAPQPRLADLPMLVAKLNSAGGSVSLEVHGEPRTLPIGIELAAYRILEEALAGESARVDVRYRPQALEIEIAKHASPRSDAERAGSLSAIRERVALYGGRLDHDSVGTRVVLPVR
jgi:signal transduction histidine kinase